jgi:hypothetical protein
VTTKFKAGRSLSAAIGCIKRPAASCAGRTHVSTSWRGGPHGPLDGRAVRKTPLGERAVSGSHAVSILLVVVLHANSRLWAANGAMRVFVFFVIPWRCARSPAGERSRWARSTFGARAASFPCVDHRARLLPQPGPDAHQAAVHAHLPQRQPGDDSVRPQLEPRHRGEVLPALAGAGLRAAGAAARLARGSRAGADLPGVRARTARRLPGTTAHLWLSALLLLRREPGGLCAGDGAAPPSDLRAAGRARERAAGAAHARARGRRASSIRSRLRWR